MQGEAGGTANRREAALVRPFNGGREQSSSDRIVFNALKEPEPGDVFAMSFVMAWIYECGDGAERLAAAPGEEIFAIQVLPGRVVPLIEQFAAHREQRRRPILVIAVELPGQDETVRAGRREC